MVSDAYTWVFLDRAGRPMAGEPLVGSPFPSQADAEAWFSESWAELAEAGVSSVTLQCNGVDVYGPMSLDAPD